MTPRTPDDLPQSDADALAAMRLDYGDRPLRRADLAADWSAQFAAWFAEAVAAGVPEPNAMVLATASVAGRPSTRTVLLKAYDLRGYTFFTNYASRKGAELAENPYASLLFPWILLHRQVVVCGAVERLDRAGTEAYFASRPRESQLGAWASAQSTVVADREALEATYVAAAERFPGEVPAPPHWGGFRVVPDSVEFWQGRRGRLHDRLRFRRDGTAWVVERLAP